MYLESLVIKNYRKFYSTNNLVLFVAPEPISSSVEEGGLESVISPSTTLIIGKNNVGKTTISNALRMVCHSEQPLASDFNLSYLSDLFSQYKEAFEKDQKTNFEDLETPELEFTLTISVNFNDEDLMTNLAPFIPISEGEGNSPVRAIILIKIRLSEESLFKNVVSDIFGEAVTDGEQAGNKKLFEKFYMALSLESGTIKTDGNLYKIEFIDQQGNVTEKFSLEKLINIKEIKANRHLKDGVLSNVFNKIVSFQFANDANARSQLEVNIKEINTKITGSVNSKSADISEVLSKIEDSNKVDLNLSGNVTYNSIMKGLIKYSFMDGDDYIPEEQFGLGYINLLNIIGEIIHFVDTYENKSHFSCVNLLFIEEPEAFMHPQMQEFFIKRIDNAVKKALELANKSSNNKKILQCQIVITTHSSHIVNSKIHSSNTLNNINYLTSSYRCARVINLTDEAIVSDECSTHQEILSFIKKHIKYKVSELFFSDALIFVEGITEEVLLNYFLGVDKVLSNYYISVFNINGAHGKLYLPLAKKLGIPSLIITDLDIKREKCEKNKKHDKDESCDICHQKAIGTATSFQEGTSPSFAQITSLHGRKTTNATLKELNKRLNKTTDEDADSLENIKFFNDDNVYVVFQREPIEGQQATSFEEAFILTNYNNDILKSVLKKCKPRIYTSLLNDSGGEANLIHHSYELQNKLSDSKSDFSNELLFKFLSEVDDTKLPSLPKYIKDGMDFLKRTLQNQ